MAIQHISVWSRKVEREKREKEKAEVVRRKWATWIIAGYKKQLCVGWI